MIFNPSNILTELQKVAPSLGARVLSDLKALEDMPVEVNWPDQDGTGSETRRVIAVSVENSGTPEVVTLRLICGKNYEEE